MLNKKIFLISILLLFSTFVYSVETTDYRDFVLNCSTKYGTYQGGTDGCDGLFDYSVLDSTNISDCTTGLCNATIYLNDTFYFVNNINVSTAETESPLDVYYFVININGVDYFYFTDELLSIGCSGGTGQTVRNILNQSIYIPEGFTEFNVLQYDDGNLDGCGVTRTVIRELYMSFVNDSNYVPEFNISLENSVLCLDEHTNTKSFNFTINVSDVENDTIYYAIDNFITENITISKRYSKTYILPFNIQLPHLLYSSFNEFKNYSDSCSINYDIDNIDLDFFNFLKNTNKYNILRYMLYLDGGCSATDKSFYVKLNKIFSNFFYYTDLYDLTNGDNFNITFLDVYRTKEIIKLNFNVTNDDVFISSVINDSFYLIINESLINGYLGLSIIDNLNDSGKYSLFLYDYYDVGTSINDLNKSNYDLIQIIKISLGNITLISQEDYIYSGLFSLPDFSIVKPSAINISDVGISYFSVYVTDELHLGSYISKTVAVELLPYEFCILNDINNNIISNLYPQTNFSLLNDLIYGMRQLYIIFLNAGILESMLFAIKLGIIILLYKRYKFLTEQAYKTSEEAIRVIFVTTFFLTSVLYLAYLIEKSWFVTFSITGILYLSNEFLNITGNNSGSDMDKNIVYTVAFFSIFIYIWFSLFGFVSGVSFGNPTLSEINVSNPIGSLNNIWSFFIDILFYAIPDIPEFLNITFFVLRIISYFSLILVIKNAINPLGN